MSEAAQVNHNPVPIPDEILDCFTQATATTYSSIFGSAPTWTEGDPSPSGEEMVGVISFMGELPLTYLLGIPREASIQMAEKFVGMPIDYSSPEMADVVGELANVIAGDIVARLEKVNCKAQMGLPTIARGQMEIIQQARQPCRTVLMEGSEGPFWFRVTTAWTTK